MHAETRRYWRVVNLAQSGAAISQIVDKIVLATNSTPIVRVTITRVVESILENLSLVRASGIDPGSPGLKRGSVSANFQKPRPVSISTYRASYIPGLVDVSDSVSKLKAAEQQDEKMISEALKLTGQREVVRKRSESDEKRYAEAALDLEMRRVLKKHLAAENQADQAKALLEMMKATVP